MLRLNSLDNLATINVSLIYAFKLAHIEQDLDREMLLRILRDVVSGMRFLHSASPPIVHG